MAYDTKLFDIPVESNKKDYVQNVISKLSNIVPRECCLTGTCREIIDNITCQKTELNENEYPNNIEFISHKSLNIYTKYVIESFTIHQLRQYVKNKYNIILNWRIVYNVYSYMTDFDILYIHIDDFIFKYKVYQRYEIAHAKIEENYDALNNRIKTRGIIIPKLDEIRGEYPSNSYYSFREYLEQCSIRSVSSYFSKNWNQIETNLSLTEEIASYV